MTEHRAAYGAGEKKEGMTVEEFLKKWETGWEQILYRDVGKREKMRADLEEMIKAARKDLTLQEAMDMLQDL